MTTHITPVRRAVLALPSGRSGHSAGATAPARRPTDRPRWHRSTPTARPVGQPSRLPGSSCARGAPRPPAAATGPRGASGGRAGPLRGRVAAARPRAVCGRIDPRRASRVDLPGAARFVLRPRRASAAGHRHGPAGRLRRPRRALARPCRSVRTAGGSAGAARGAAPWLAAAAARAVLPGALSTGNVVGVSNRSREEVNRPTALASIDASGSTP